MLIYRPIVAFTEDQIRVWKVQNKAIEMVLFLIKQVLKCLKSLIKGHVRVKYSWTSPSDSSIDPNSSHIQPESK